MKRMIKSSSDSKKQKTYIYDGPVLWNGQKVDDIYLETLAVSKRSAIFNFMYRIKNIEYKDDVYIKHRFNTEYFYIDEDCVRLYSPKPKPIEKINDEEINMETEEPEQLSLGI